MSHPTMLPTPVNDEPTRAEIEHFAEEPQLPEEMVEQMIVESFSQDDSGRIHESQYPRLTRL